MSNHAVIRQEELETARKMKKDWIAAEQAVMTSQEYRMGTKILRRADLNMIAERVRYWTSELERLQGVSRIRIQQVVPRDR